MEEPFRAAFPESNILTTYAKAGIWPFNPGAIPTAIHELSKPVAIDGEFPAGPCSPIKAIVAGYQQEWCAMLPQGPGIQDTVKSICGDYCGGFHHKSKSPQILVVKTAASPNHHKSCGGFCHKYLWAVQFGG